MIPDIGISNGIMSVILNYAKAMPDDIKFDVVYFAEKEKNKKAEIKMLGGRTYRINPPSPKTAIKGEMDKFFKAHKGEWEVLHINAPHFTVFIAPAAKRAGIKKICCHCHSTLFSLNPNNLKRNELLNMPTRYLVDKKFACSKAAGDYWYKNNYCVLKNAIDCSKYVFNDEKRALIRNKMNITDKLVIGHIGRTDVSQKNHSFLLKIFAEIHKKKPNSELLLIGGTSNERLEQFCREEEITDSVEFLGLRNDVNDLLQACDVFLFPSISEGLPVSVIEAQAAGLPVLMSESVTDEVVVTDNVVSLSLNESVTKWAQQAIKLSMSERINTLQAMQSAGWDVFSCSTTLINYYRG